MAKGLRKPIARSTHTRTDKKLQRVFVDLSGKMIVPSIGGQWYTLIVRDDCTRFTRVYFLGKKSNTANAFESFLAEVRVDGTPFAVMATRPDNGGEVFGGDFGKLCRKRGIKQVFHVSRQSEVQRCSRTSISTVQRHYPRCAHPSTSSVPGRTGLPVLVGESGVLGVPHPESHRNHRQS